MCIRDRSNTEADLKALSNYLAIMILIWGGCLSITLLTVSWVVQRIVKPLNQLNLATADLTAEKLSDTRLQLDQAPTEIEDLQDTFNSWSNAWPNHGASKSNLSAPLAMNCVRP